MGLPIVLCRTLRIVGVSATLATALRIYGMHKYMGITEEQIIDSLVVITSCEFSGTFEWTR